jgi:hypothetical protein
MVTRSKELSNCVNLRLASASEFWHFLLWCALKPRLKFSLRVIISFLPCHQCSVSPMRLGRQDNGSHICQKRQYLALKVTHVSTWEAFQGTRAPVTPTFHETSTRLSLSYWDDRMNLEFGDAPLSSNGNTVHLHQDLDQSAGVPDLYGIAVLTPCQCIVH